jgi:hypothetical protein
MSSAKMKRMFGWLPSAAAVVQLNKSRDTSPEKYFREVFMIVFVDCERTVIR